MKQINNKSPRKDSYGRDLFRVVMTDGLKVKTIFIYAFNVLFAIEKAKNNHPYLTFCRARQETDGYADDTGVQQ